MARSDEPGRIRRADPRVTAYVAQNREAKAQRYQSRKLARVLTRAEGSLASSASAQSYDWSDADPATNTPPAVIPAGASTNRVEPAALNAAWRQALPQVAHLPQHDQDRLRTLLLAVLAGDDPNAARAWQKAMSQLAQIHRQAGERMAQDFDAKSHSSRRQTFTPRW